MELAVLKQNFCKVFSDLLGTIGSYADKVREKLFESS